MWSFRALVFVSPHPSSARSWSRAGRLMGSTLVLIRLVRIGTPVTLTFIETSPQHCDLDEFVVKLS